MAATVPQRLHAGTLKRAVGMLDYFADWDDQRLSEVVPYVAALSLEPQAELLALGDLSPYDYFLLGGELMLTAADGKTRRMTDAGVDAGFPIAHLRPSMYRVVAVRPSRVLRIEASVLKWFAQTRSRARFRLDDTVRAGTWQAHPLVASFLRQARSGRLALPPLPDIALKVQKAVTDPDLRLDDMARLIGADPAIAATLVRMANSALLGGVSPIRSLGQALVRLGIQRVQSLVTALSFRGLYRAREPAVRERMKKAWRHAVEIGALALVVAERRGLEGDHALLIGLLHECGTMPLLRLAEQHADLMKQPALLDEIVEGLAPKASALLLESWSMSEDFVDAALEASSYYRDSPVLDYTDLVIVAHLHALVRSRDIRRLPRLDETPAFLKLADGRITPQLSLGILGDAKCEIAELRDLLADAA